MSDKKPLEDMLDLLWDELSEEPVDQIMYISQENMELLEKVTFDWASPAGLKKLFPWVSFTAQTQYGHPD